MGSSRKPSAAKRVVSKNKVLFGPMLVPLNTRRRDIIENQNRVNFLRVTQVKTQNHRRARHIGVGPSRNPSGTTSTYGFMIKAKPRSLNPGAPVLVPI